MDIFIDQEYEMSVQMELGLDFSTIGEGSQLNFYQIGFTCL